MSNNKDMKYKKGSVGHVLHMIHKLNIVNKNRMGLLPDYDNKILSPKLNTWNNFIKKIYGVNNFDNINNIIKNIELEYPSRPLGKYISYIIRNTVKQEQKLSWDENKLKFKSFIKLEWNNYTHLDETEKEGYSNQFNEEKFFMILKLYSLKNFCSLVILLKILRIKMDMKYLKYFKE